MPSLSLLRRFHAPSDTDLAAACAVRPALDQPAQQLIELGEAWLSLLEYEQESERLANMAAINRWQLLRALERLESAQLPGLLLAPQRDLAALLADAGRAFQLLATGHRFHKTEAVCDGQSLLVASLSGGRRLLRALDQQLGTADEARKAG